MPSLTDNFFILKSVLYPHESEYCVSTCQFRFYPFMVLVISSIESIIACCISLVDTIGILASFHNTEIIHRFHQFIRFQWFYFRPTGKSMIVDLFGVMNFYHLGW